jgi:hypothetical protein
MNKTQNETVCSGEGCDRTIETPANASLAFTYTCAACCDARMYGRNDEEQAEILKIKYAVEYKLRNLSGFENEDYEIAA